MGQLEAAGTRPGVAAGVMKHLFGFSRVDQITGWAHYLIPLYVWGQIGNRPQCYRFNLDAAARPARSLMRTTQELI
jgi:hypothetical protein